jgi:hypothetical protein
MGGCTFWNRATGKTAAEAFASVTEAARYEHGHGGYSGTIAEKHDFVMLAVPKGTDPIAYSKTDEALDQVDDKWGPAGCVALGDGKWIFFGWASS